MDGIIIIDKPSGMTSHDVVQAIRRMAGVVKAGHGGTLDPLATGVLPILINNATKLSARLTSSGKEYLVTMKLGQATDTDDADGGIIYSRPVPAISGGRLDEVLSRFCGVIRQVPPKYSAIKYKGRPMYKLARKGITVNPAPREVEISKITLVTYRPPLITLKVACSKGTYIRALVRDIGEALSCGAHVISLRRLACGPFKIEEASPLSEVCALQSLAPVLREPSHFLWRYS